MSLNKNSSTDSSSDFEFPEYDEWEERVHQQNRQINQIIEDMIITHPNMFVSAPQPTNRRRYINREHEIGHERLMNDYFVEYPTYTPQMFRRRFRMQRPLFLRTVEAVTANDEFFQQKLNASGRQGLSPLQKCTGAMRVLAYGVSSDVVDEYLRMSGATTRKALLHFVDGVISCFGETYLRRPNQQDLARLLYVGEQRGFPGMIGSIDCMHWGWKNCPTAWAGQYTGRGGSPTIILEAVASYDLWIWHAFFGTPGSCNDINVLHQSPVFSDVLEGRSPKVNYVVNGRQNDRAYYLTDGIYPSWAAFVKSIIAPQTKKHRLFAQHQESARKDVERAFGVLQARFAFLRRPCLIWDKVVMGKIIMACIILHNMIVEDERHTYQNYHDLLEFLADIPTGVQSEDVESSNFSTQRISSLSAYMINRYELPNRQAHQTLKHDLIEHIWEKFETHN